MKSTLAALALFFCLSSSPTFAYPPAPGITIYGTVRDTNGWAINSADAEIVFHSGDTEIARTALNSSLTFGQNYQVLLALDMEPDNGSYRDDIVRAIHPFTVTVEIGSDTFVPIETEIDHVPTTDPGSNLQLNFTLGEDSDGDGLPDEWELAQLLRSGLNTNSENYNLNQFSADGDYDEDGLSDYHEYIAGTFAYLGSDTLALSILSRSENGWLELEFLAIADKSYLFEASTDLKTWTPVEVAIDQDQTDLRSAYPSEDTQMLKVSAPPSEDGTTRYFRVKVS